MVLEHLLFHILAPQHHGDRTKLGESFHLACDLIINQNISQIRENPKDFSRKTSPFGKLLTPQALKGLHGFNAESLASTSVYELWPLIKEENHLPNLSSYKTLDETDFQLHNFVSINRWQKLAPGNEILLQNQVKQTVIAAMMELHRLGKGQAISLGASQNRSLRFLLKAKSITQAYCKNLSAERWLTSNREPGLAPIESIQILLKAARD